MVRRVVLFALPIPAWEARVDLLDDLEDSVIRRLLLTIL